MLAWARGDDGFLSVAFVGAAQLETISGRLARCNRATIGCRHATRIDAVTWLPARAGVTGRDQTRSLKLRHRPAIQETETPWRPAAHGRVLVMWRMFGKRGMARSLLAGFDDPNIGSGRILIEISCV